MRRYRTFLMSLVSLSVSSAQTPINLQGRVLNQHGHPMSKATLSLMNSSATATTSANGSFTLTGTAKSTGLSNHARSSSTPSIGMSIREGNLSIRFGRAEDARVELFDAEGNLLGMGRTGAEENTAIVPLKKTGPRILFVRIRSGGKTHTGQFVISGTPMAKNVGALSLSSGIGAAKQLAVVDKIIIKHGTFTYDSVDIESYQNSNLTVNMTIPEVGTSGLKILYPNGKEVLSSSSTAQIVWAFSRNSGCAWEFVLELSKNAGVAYTLLNKTYREPDGYNAPYTLEVANKSYWNPENINTNSNVPGYVMYMDSLSSLGIGFWKVSLSSYAGTQNLARVRDQYCQDASRQFRNDVSDDVWTAQ